MTPQERFKEIKDNQAKYANRLPFYSHADHAWLIARVEQLEDALQKINQFQDLPLNDTETVLKKHHVMGSFAREALSTDPVEALRNQGDE